MSIEEITAAAWYPDKDPAYQFYLREEELERTAIYRAGEIVQGLLYIFQEASFGKLVLGVDKSGSSGTLLVHTLIPSKNQKSWDFNIHDFLRPFPSNLFPQVKAKQAMLTFRADHVLDWLHNVILQFSKGICASISERSFIPHKARVHIIEICRGGKALKGMKEIVSGRVHRILAINQKMCPELGFALDLLGAQHGIWDPITTGSEYMEEEVGSIENFLEPVIGIYDLAKRVMHKEAGKKAKGSLEAVEARVREELSVCMMTAIMKWEMQNKINENEMIALRIPKLNEEEFEAKKKSLLLFVEEELRKRVCIMKEKELDRAVEMEV